VRRNIPGKPPAKRISGLQAKSPSLFLSLYLNLFLSPPPLGGLRPPPARSRPPGIPPRSHDHPQWEQPSKDARQKAINAHYLAIGTGDTELYIVTGMLAAVVISIRVFLFRGAGKAN
jgi:hypothetical protein